MAKAGLALYIFNIFPYSFGIDLCRNINGFFKSLFIDVKCGGKDLVVGIIYRFPSGSVSMHP